MNETPSKPVAYFDGACPVCAREVALYQSRPGAQNLCWIDASRAQPAALPPGLSREAALARFHLRRADGQLVSGAAAFAALWLCLPGWAWLGRVVSHRAAAPVFEAAYRGFLVVRRLWRKPASGR
jgi:predicted DCC family thiol-disulfide oxidoreductase YuxK